MDNCFHIINSGQPIRNGIAVVQPMPGQVLIAGAAGTGSGGYIYQDTDPMRVQAFTNINGLENVIDGRYLPEEPYSVQTTTADTAGAVNADAILAYAAAGPNRQHVLGSIEFGYSATPLAGSGSIRIEDGAGVVVFGPVPVVAAGPNQFKWEEGKRFSANTGLSVILSKAGASVSGNVSATHWLI